MEYNPKITPEITLFFIPLEERGVEITEIKINNEDISGDLEEDLLKLHGDAWEKEILRDIDNQNFMDRGEYKYENRK